MHAGTSLDQLYAQRFGQDTPIPSMQLSIETVDQSGGCAYGYSCAYTDSISWAHAEHAAADDPRSARRLRLAVRRRRNAGRARRDRRTDKSILDWVTRRSGAAAEAARRRRPRPPRVRTSRKCAKWSAASSASSRTTPAVKCASCRQRPVGVPDAFARARQADVRPAGAGVRVGRDARVLVQDGPRRFGARLSRQRRPRRVPPRVAPRRARRARHRLHEDQPLPRQHGSVLPRRS